MYCAITMSMAQDVAGHDFLYSDYGQFFENLGYQLIYLPNLSKNFNEYFDQLPIRALILSGGNDLSPEFTGDKPLDIRNSAPERDKAEKVILDLAIERGLPVIGICRGMHFINCYFGGKLTQIIDDERHVRQKHLISFCDERVNRLVKSKEITVNSYHHQGIVIEQFSKQLKPLAVSVPDGLIEALYHPDFPIVGIQWHPERTGIKGDDDTKLIKAFLDKNNYWRKI